LSNTSRSTSRLKSLELQGYKTFASKTVFEFAPSITAIVGPNGSGKSNIADSLRWVFGEQSYSLLRGKKTEDMIFSGSENRSRASMAAVSVTFDNSDGWLPIEFGEVSIGRRAYRDGQNEYLLNGQKVRLRDVSELLAKCGLAERTYTIIGQGLVDAALSLKAEERRRLFEEAAGIGLYRSRRDEALRRLESTRRNLERVQDILAELRPRLRSLERQARRAEDYEHVKDDLDNALRIWYGYHWYRLQRQVGVARQHAQEAAAARQVVRLRLARAEQQVDELRTHLDGQRSQLHDRSLSLSKFYSQREGLGRRLAVAQERLRWLDEQDNLAADEVEAIAEEMAQLEARRRDLESDSALLQAEVDQARTQVEALRGVGEVTSEERQAIEARLAEVRQALEQTTAQLTITSAEMAQHAERRRIHHQRRQAMEIEVRQAQQARDQAQSALQGADQARQAAEAEVKRFEGVAAAAAGALKAAEGELAQQAANHSAARAQLAALKAHLESLSTLEARSADVTAQFLQAAGEGRMPGLLGPLQRVLEIQPEFRVAIQAALGRFRHALAFGGAAELHAALAFFKEGEQGDRAALLPSDGARRRMLAVPPDSACLGNAADLVRVPAPYRPAVELILGRTLVVSSRAEAVRVAAGLPEDACVVTAAGDLFLPNGAVLLGAGGEEAQAFTRQELQGRMDRAEIDLRSAKEALGQAAQAVDAGRKELEAARQRSEAGLAELRKTALRHDETVLAAEMTRRRWEQAQGGQAALATELAPLEAALAAGERRNAELEDQRFKLTQALKAVQAQSERAHISANMAQAEARLELARQAFEESRLRGEELGERLLRLEGEQSRRQAQVLEAQHEREALQAEAALASEGLAALEAQLGQLNAELVEAERTLAAGEAERTALEAGVGHVRSDQQAAEHTYSQTQIELARRQEELASMRHRIEDDFGLVTFEYDDEATVQEPLPFEGLVERLTQVETLPPESEVHVNHLRAQLRRMGAVNFEARREHQEVKQRVEFLTAQVDDLRRAESQLQEVIAELDLLMEREFRQTFEAVAAAFRQTFTRLFGGGSVRLSLTDPDDFNNTGIDIEARLPGRREQGLAMLSGGERSLTACALVFALIKVSPTPFCVLDEVDAMLDEANVQRFRELLSELSAQTQFLVITHNRQTVQAAEAVYGVTMGPDTASKVISINLAEMAEDAA
jgi:chromosome segregation protein